MNFGEKLEMLRIKSGLNKKQLGEQVEIAADTISKYIKQDTIEGIDAYRLKRLADFFSVPLDYFANNTENATKDITKDNIKYLNCEDVNNINLIDFVSEFKYYLLNLDFNFNSVHLNKEDKKYIIDSLEIGIKLLNSNFKK